MKQSVANPEQTAGYQKYVTGFSLSIALTVLAYWLVKHHAFSKNISVIIVLVLALAQFTVQMYYFLHLGEEAKPRWKQLVFMGMFGVVLILVIGSIWIMTNLNYHHPQIESPQQLDKSIIKDEGVKP